MSKTEIRKITAAKGKSDKKFWITNYGSDEKTFWAFEDGNMYMTEKYTEDEAKKLHETLQDCHGCIDCENCVSCTDCENCSDCVRCQNCQECISCLECRDSQACDTCIGCDLLLACAYEKEISHINGFEEDYQPEKYRKSAKLKRQRRKAYEEAVKSKSVTKEKKKISAEDIASLDSLSGITVLSERREYGGCEEVEEGYMLRNARPPYPKSAVVSVTSMGYVEMAFLAEENADAVYRDEYFADFGENGQARIVLYTPADDSVILSAVNIPTSPEQAKQMTKKGWKKKGVAFEKTVSLKWLKENALKIFRTRTVIFPPEYRILEKDAENWLGPMREATHEEQQSVEDYVESISVNTGVKFFDS